MSTVGRPVDEPNPYYEAAARAELMAGVLSRQPAEPEPEGEDLTPEELKGIEDAAYFARIACAAPSRRGYQGLQGDSVHNWS